MGLNEFERNTDWRMQLPEHQRRYVRAWFGLIAATTMLVLVVGGATRLTHSGLSMVEWQPILGVIPPLNDAQWQERFVQYQQFPEYQKLRSAMTMHEFKFIFLWEYLHRLLARAIGIVFLIPFAFFLLRRRLNRPLFLRSLALFALGALQGVMGWLMVASGLVDRPSVSHFRLAAHLSLAFLIFGYAVWLARELAVTEVRHRIDPIAKRRIKRGLAIVGGLLAIQIVWGAFVAGLKAGFFANTFPLMGGRLIPTGLMDRVPAWANFVSNPIMVQWLHRVIGTVLALAVVGLAVTALRQAVDSFSRRLAIALVILVGVQYLLGVLTLVYAVPVGLGVTHQAFALLLFGAWVMWVHHARELQSV
ncbi:MAG: COX15/CtaA family protein [Gemmatimonadota bacterium]